MELLTKTQEQKLIENETNNVDDAKVVVKLFNPEGAGTWFLHKLVKKDDIAYGLCHIMEPEYGAVSMRELRDYIGRMGLGIERDIHFPENKYTIDEVQAALEIGETL